MAWRPWTRIAVSRSAETRSGCGADRGLVDGCHGAQPVGVAPDASCEVRRVVAEHAVDVDEPPVDPRVVHLRDAARRAVCEVGEVRRVDLLGDVLPVDRPDEPSMGVVDPKRRVGGAQRVIGRGIQQPARVGRGAVAHPPRRLVVQRMPHLEAR